MRMNWRCQLAVSGWLDMWTQQQHVVRTDVRAKVDGNLFVEQVDANVMIGNLVHHFRLFPKPITTIMWRSKMVSTR